MTTTEMILMSYVNFSVGSFRIHLGI